MGGEIIPTEKLVQLCSKIGSGATPRGGSSVYLDSGEISLIRSQNVLDNEFSRVGLVFIEPEAAGRLSNVVVEEGDVLLNITGDSVARCCQVDSGILPARVNQHVAIIRPKKELLNAKYLRYFLVSAPMQNYMLGLAGAGATRNALTKGMIEDFDVPLPRFETQKAIAHILGTLDDKIELNRQMNATLEAMAQALFKSWFVDFDPVIDNVLAAGNSIPEPLQAKAEVRAALGDQRKPLPEAIQKQFPSRFVFSEEMGWIPEGWTVEELPNVIDFLEGPGIRNWQYTESDNGIKFINIRCIQNGDLLLDTANRITKDEAFGKYAHFQLAVDDIVVSTSGTLGRYAFVRKEHLPLSLNTSVIRFRKIEGVSTLHLIAGYVDTKLQWELEIRASGSVQRNFGPMHLKQIKMLLPKFDILQSHEAIVEPLFRKRQANLIGSDGILKLRDTLLPKLLSGELRIPDAEKLVADSV